MRRKQLNGIAASMAQKFAASAEHFAYLAALYSKSKIEINLMTSEISPVAFNIERNRNLVRMCVDNLRALVDEDELSQATLIAQFNYETDDQRSSIRSGMIEVRLVTRAGKEATGYSVNTPQMLAQ
jgi:hypothetical protein